RNSWYCGGRLLYDCVVTISACDSLIGRELVPQTWFPQCSSQWENVKFTVRAPPVDGGIMGRKPRDAQDDRKFR
ncbi:unnamed protein product, partial [Staurois parvus]